MVIQAEGRVVFNNIICEKCGFKVCVSDENYEYLKCKDCGAVYKLSHNEIEGSQAKKIYEFKEFRCIYNFGLTECNNKCLSSEMYCEEHVSDECFKSVKDNIDYLNRRLDNAKRTLDRMEESKKLILIQKVSGAYEEDCVVREDKTGKS